MACGRGPAWPWLRSKGRTISGTGGSVRGGTRAAAAPAWEPGRGTHSGQGPLDVLSGSRNVPQDHACAVLLQTVQKEPVFSFIKNFIISKNTGTLCPSCGARGSDVQDGSSAGQRGARGARALPPWPRPQACAC